MKNNIIKVNQERWEKLRERVKSNDSFEGVQNNKDNNIIKVNKTQWEKKYRPIVRAKERLKEFLNIFNIKDKKIDILELIESTGTFVNYDDLKESYFGYIEKNDDGVNFIIEYKYSDDLAMESKIIAYLTSVYCYFESIFEIKDFDELKNLSEKAKYTLDVLKFDFFGYRKKKEIKNIYFSLDEENLKNLKKICPEIHHFAKGLYKLDYNASYENKEF